MAELHAWPFRSLPRRGMVWFLASTAAMITLPLIVVVGSPILWGLLPFFAIAIAGIWLALNRSYRDGEILEELRLWPDKITLARHNPKGPAQTWEANPHWVSVHMHPKDGPVENYLTLKGGGREVELGAFLSPEERAELHDAVQDRLNAARTHINA